MKYHVHITSSDPLGYNLIENVIAIANLGGKMKEGTMPSMRFPHSVSMELEADEPPTPNAFIRVFEFDSCKEVFAAFVEPKAQGFAMDVEKVDKSLNDGKPWTKEQLDAMDWDTEFKVVMADADIGGKQRARMTKDYLAKFE